MKKLTAKQEQFILKIVEGVSKTEAYKMIYDTSKMKDKTISKRAYDLFNKPIIQNRYEELMNELKESSKWTIERAVDDLIWLKEEARRNIEENGLKQANSNAYLSSIKELNTLLGLYPKKIIEQDDTENNIADNLLGIMDGIRRLHNGTNQ